MRFQSVGQTFTEAATTMSSIKEYDDDTWTVVHFVFSVGVAVVGIPLNLCTVILLCKFRCLPNVVSIAAINLSCVELMTSSYMIYHSVALFHDGWFSYHTTCTSLHTILQLKITLTVTIFVYVAIDQTILAYVGGEFYQSWTRKPKIYVISFLIWILALTLAIILPVLPLHSDWKIHYRTATVCYQEEVIKQQYSYAMLSYIATCVLITLILLLTVATKYACCGRRHDRLHLQETYSSVGLFTNSRTRNAKRVYILCVLLIIMFIVCTALWLIVNLIHVHNGRSKRSTNVERVAFILLILHSIVIQIIYICRVTNIRRGYSRFLRGDCGGSRHTLARTTDSVQLYGMSFTTHVTGVVLNLQARIKRKTSLKNTTPKIVVTGDATNETVVSKQETSKSKDNNNCGSGLVWCTNATPSDDNCYGYNRNKRNDSLQVPVMEYF